MAGETLWVGSHDPAVHAAARELVTVVEPDTVPRADFESVDRERRALNLEADTYRQCIEDAGGLPALRALVGDAVPVSPEQPAALAGWIAFCEAGCPVATPLPWAEPVPAGLSREGTGPALREAPSGASRRSGVAA